jgi:hypothetical protein
MTELEVGVLYDRSDEHTAEWFLDVLAARVEHRPRGTVRIIVQRMDGASIEGRLIMIDENLIAVEDAGFRSPRGPRAWVVGIPAQEVASVTLLPESDPPDWLGE